ncbi:hypothetical protein HELRODRAFT_163145 [Helobdella robusta]|uniref:Tyrosine-protein phosphatase domain-containing protein n=1 Tax=Helobdella robusta TaxID=6412 RepID=T1ETQ3_HELRO|nr:hypothetical protein HELRODRAFT_163145 [Helobdella robusta]ESN96117.1 hypothetical protein HELRODRAFT_163145 [Helobdella robusta]
MIVKETYAKYWPDNGTMKINVTRKRSNHISVTFQRVESWPTYEIRTFAVVYLSTKMIVTHMWYRCWSERDVPENIGSLLNFHHAVKCRVVNNENNNNPLSYVLVHCRILCFVGIFSTGVGRTGAFLGLDYLLEECDDVGSVDVFQCLQFLRSQRNCMVQSVEQCDFLFQALIEYSKLGHTTCFSTRNKEFSNFVNSKEFKNSIETQYKALIENSLKSGDEKNGVETRIERIHNPHSIWRCFTKSRAILTCEINDSLTGDELFRDIILKKIIPKPGEFFEFSSYTVLNCTSVYENDRNIYTNTKDDVNDDDNNDVTILKVTNSGYDYVVGNDDAYERSESDVHYVKVFQYKALNEIASLYKSIKTELKNSQAPIIPVLYGPSEDRILNETLVMLSLLEMVDTHEHADVFQTVLQLQPHTDHNLNPTYDAYSYNNDEVFITMNQYIHIHQAVKSLSEKRPLSDHLYTQLTDDIKLSKRSTIYN